MRGVFVRVGPNPIATQVLTKVRTSCLPSALQSLQ